MKVTCTVWMRGKDRDNFKVLPIHIYFAFYLILTAILALESYFHLQAQEAPSKSNEEFLSIDTRERPFSEIIECIREMTGQNISYEESIRDVFVTIRLRDVHWRMALQAIAQKYQCGVEETDGTIKVAKLSVVSMDEYGADLSEIIRRIVQAASRPIQISECVKGKVSVRFQNVTWLDALQAVLNVSGYACLQEEGGSLRIGNPMEICPLQLRSSNSAIRLNACQKLGRLGSKARGAVPGLLLALQDTDHLVRQSAAMALGRIGDRSDATITALVKAMQDKDKSVRYTASVSLMCMGEKMDDARKALEETILANLKPSQAEKKVIVEDPIDPEEMTEEVKTPKEEKVILDIPIEPTFSFSRDQKPTVTMDIEAGDIQKILYGISKMANRDIVISEAVKGSISLHFKNVSYRDAFQSIACSSSDLFLQREDGIFQVAVSQKEDGIFQVAVSQKMALDADFLLQQEDGILQVTVSSEMVSFVVALAQVWTSLLNSSKSEVRTRALYELCQLGRNASIAASKVIPLLQDQDDIVRMMVLQATGAKSDAVALRLVEASNREARYWAMSELLKMQENAEVTMPAFEEALKSALRNPNEEIRKDASETLGILGTKAIRAVPDMIRALADSERKVRDMAAWALGNIGPKASQAIPNLLSMWVNSDNYSRYQEVLAKIEPNWQNLEAIVKLIPGLIEKLANSKAQSRYTAAKILGDIGPKAVDAVPALTKVLADSSRYVRKAAAEALGKLGSKAAPSVADLINVLWDSDNEISQCALESLEKIEPKWRESATVLGKIPDLMKDLGSPDSKVRIKAARLLGVIGRSEAVPDLIKALVDPDPSVRDTAERALENISRASK